MLRFSPLTECLASIGVHSYSDETTLHVSIWKKRGVAGRLAFEAALKLHDAPLELIAFVDSRRHLLSLDAGGTFNVYSSVLLTPTSEPWECLQRFQVAPSPGPHRNRILSCFVVPESPASDAVLVTAGHRVTFYDVCEVKEREEVFFTSFCQALNLLVGVTATKLLFWKADTGGLWKTFEYAAILSASSDAALLSASNRPGGERGSARSITAACIDDRERKVILGDDAGSLRVINAVNGNVMKELDPHAQAVASVSYVLRGKCVVSVSVDSCLHIYDENNALGYYVPFGAAHPQSVLLHSLRFLPEGIDSSLTMSYEPPPERFDILKSVGNLALDRVAVLTSGSRGESFVQVWSFDLSHTHGTCVAPLDDEITCVSFLGASADIVGGTASGRHVFAVHATVALEAAEMSSSVAADADDNDEATDTFPLMGLRDAATGGVCVFAGDELGIVTKWVVRPTVASSSDSAGAVLQHEEMALGYEAVAGLYNRAFDQERRGAAALGESSDSHLSPSRRRKPRTRLARLLPTSRWDAHTSPILCLNYALDPLVVLTASTCGRVKVWSFGGELLGVLDDFASRRQPETQPWRVPLDMGERRRRKEQDAQQFLDKFKGTHRRGKQPRLSVLQERLALSHEELAFDYAAEKKTQQRRRHSRLPVRTSDVGRAIRKFVLAQASAPAAAANVASRRSSTTPTSSTLKVDDSSRSLQVVLKEIDQLQSQTSARTGSAGASSHRDGGIAALAPNASADSLPATRKKRYPRVTLADVKPLLAAFRPRSSSNAVHCELPQLHAQPSNDERRPPPASRKNEIVFTSASFVKRSTGVSSYALQVAEADARLTVLDLRDDAGASNQEPKTRPLAVATPAQGSSDPVLTHHVKLAHIWRHQP
ncbi:hypothetical protein PybrP1_006808 [[Pythium] brassicae (nom. inval.)]|nr:hypothetical protein PybrP1_006808 [[Pythium] brassicae (nom. inval.)]